jgi:AhpD family alkylhydroperoxidase
MDRRDVVREAKDLVGEVPGFLMTIPEPHIGTVWAAIRDLQLSPGKVPAKYQQLLMLAVATNIRCRYGRELHTEIAKAFGATPEEIVEVALLTAHTTSLSHVLGGTRYEYEAFRREIRALSDVLAGGVPSRRSSIPSPKR